MKIPTISIYSIMETFANALAADTDLNNYCETQFKKELNIFICYNTKKPITEASCPYIVIFPDQKTEGANENPYQYSIPVGWVIANEAEIKNGKITKLVGLEQCDAMGQLILNCLNEISVDHPIVSVTYGIEPIEFFPQIVGQLTATIEIERPIGASISYP